MNIDWKKFYDYISEIRENNFHQEIAEKIGDIKGCMSDHDCFLLYAIVRYFKPRFLLETGSGSGKSSSFILKALKRNGEKGNSYNPVLLGIERDHRKEIGFLIPDSLKKWFVPIRSSAEKFVESGDFKKISLDFFLHDSTHRYEHQMWEFKTFWEKLLPEGILCSHDIVYSTSFLEFVRGKYVMDERGLTDFERSNFFVWGAFGNLGFVVKK